MGVSEEQPLAVLIATRVIRTEDRDWIKDPDLRVPRNEPEDDFAIRALSLPHDVGAKNALRAQAAEAQKQLEAANAEKAAADAKLQEIDGQLKALEAPPVAAKAERAPDW